jgi:hypothetical protein
MSSVLIIHTTNKPLTTCSRSQAHSPTYLTCGGYITRNADIDGESALKWAETKKNRKCLYIMRRNKDKGKKLAVSKTEYKTAATTWELTETGATL